MALTFVLTHAKPARASGDDGEVPRAFEGRGIAADLGTSGVRDPAAAFRDYRLAAALGDANAELDLGVMQDSGVGAPVDRRAAALWYARAASRGQGRAAFDLALLYADGEGVPRDASLANAWFRDAAGLGIRSAAGRIVPVGPPATALPAPLPQFPEDGGVTGNSVELVWEPGADTAGTRFWVEVVRASDRTTPVVWAGTELSAMLIRLPASSGRYAWRVMAALPGDAQYRPGPWRTFSTDGLLAGG